MKNIIEVKNLSVSINNKEIISCLNFNVEKNRVLAIIGPSGCGKTTILKTINRLNDSKEFVMAGEVNYNRENVLKSKSLQNIRKDLGMLFQTPSPFPLSIKKNLEIVLEEWGEAQSIEGVLKTVGLDLELGDDLNKDATTLSGGQQQRLCLARMLLTDPKVLLLDEPCSSLDPISTKQIEELLLSLKKEKTIVIVTHDVHQAKRIADDVLFLWPCLDGTKIVENTNAHDFFNNSSNPVTKAYLSGELPTFS